MALNARRQACALCSRQSAYRTLASTSRLTQEAVQDSVKEQGKLDHIAAAETAVPEQDAGLSGTRKRTFQSLASFDPILDLDTVNSVVLASDRRAQGVHARDPLAVVHRNRQTLFRPSTPPASAFHAKGESDPLVPLRHVFPDITADELQDYHRYVVCVRRFKLKRKQIGTVIITNVVTCVGNGKGMLGLGTAYHTDRSKARDDASLRAIKNMTPVALCEGRTIWRSRTGKLSATVIQMWPRPPGFGISTRSTVLNRMCKAAGITDITIRLRRSRNRYFTAQLLWRMLKAEGQPIGTLGHACAVRELCQKSTQALVMDWDGEAIDWIRALA